MFPGFLVFPFLEEMQEDLASGHVKKYHHADSLTPWAPSCHEMETNMTMEKQTIWRCISYKKL